jgi:ATP-dependent RNA helicase DOB1
MDLFSFLDEQPANDSNGADSDIEIEDATPARKATSPAPNPLRKRRATASPELNGHNHNESLDGKNGEPSTKKQRAATPQPVVVDEFETEAKREVEASAGLAGPVEAGAKLELKHQVRHPTTLL